MRRWRKVGLGYDNKVDKKVLSNKVLNARYGIDKWADS
jgi:hypothetical protein